MFWIFKEKETQISLARRRMKRLLTGVILGNVVGHGLQALASDFELRQGCNADRFQDCLPSIKPIMAQQSLLHVGAAYRALSFRLLVEIPNDAGRVGRIVGKIDQRVRPVKKLFELPIVRAFPQQDAARGRSLKIPIADFDLCSTNIGPIDQTRIDDEISTSLRKIREENSMFSRVENLISRRTVVYVKQALFGGHLHEGFMRNRGPAAHTIDVDGALRRNRIVTEANRVDARGQEYAFLLT